MTRNRGMVHLRNMFHPCQGWYLHRTFLQDNSYPPLSSKTGFGVRCTWGIFFHTCHGLFLHSTFLQDNSHPHLPSKKSWQGFEGRCTWGKCFPLAKAGPCIELFYRIIPTLLYPVKQDSGYGALEEFFFTLAMACSCIALFYRIIPTLIYPVKKDLGYGALQECFSHLPWLVLA